MSPSCWKSITMFLLVVFTCALGARAAEADRLGTEWSVSESGIAGTWVRRGNSDTWDATWRNGAVAVLSITITGDRLRISRRDTGGPSAGLTATYEGTLAPDDTVQGVQTITSPSRFTQSWQGRIVAGAAPRPPISTGQSSSAYSAACGLGIRWEVSESGWTGVWIRRGNTNTFDGTWRKGDESGNSTLTISLSGNRVTIQRQDAANFTGVRYVYEGTIGADGSFSGMNSGQYPVRGRVICGETTSPMPPVASPSPLPGSGSVHYQVENLVFNAPDIYQNPRNLHDFVVDWSTCQIRNLSQEADRGIVSIKVLVCRPDVRLTFVQTNTRTGGAVDYDWAFRDNGQAVYGAWRQGSGFGPSVGGVRR